MTQKTIGPSKLTMARPISAPYSSWRLRIESGEPSKPDRFASTTSGRLPEAALIARLSQTASDLHAARDELRETHAEIEELRSYINQKLARNG